MQDSLNRALAGCLVLKLVVEVGGTDGVYLEESSLLVHVLKADGEIPAGICSLPAQAAAGEQITKPYTV